MGIVRARQPALTRIQRMGRGRNFIVPSRMHVGGQRAPQFNFLACFDENNEVEARWTYDADPETVLLDEFPGPSPAPWTSVTPATVSVEIFEQQLEVMLFDGAAGAAQAQASYGAIHTTGEHYEASTLYNAGSLSARVVNQSLGIDGNDVTPGNVSTVAYYAALNTYTHRLRANSPVLDDQQLFEYFRIDRIVALSGWAPQSAATVVTVDGVANELTVSGSLVTWVSKEITLSVQEHYITSCQGRVGTSTQAFLSVGTASGDSDLGTDATTSASNVTLQVPYYATAADNYITLANGADTGTAIFGPVQTERVVALSGWAPENGVPLITIEAQQMRIENGSAAQSSAAARVNTVATVHYFGMWKTSGTPAGGEIDVGTAAGLPDLTTVKDGDSFSFTAPGVAAYLTAVTGGTLQGEHSLFDCISIQRNWVQNGTFDLNVDHWIAGGGATVDWDAGECRVTNTTGGGYAEQLVSGFQAGKTYQFLGRLRSTGGVYYYRLHGSGLANHEVYVDGNGIAETTWESDGTDLRLWARQSTNPGTCWADDVLVREITQPLALDPEDAPLYGFPTYE